MSSIIFIFNHGTHRKHGMKRIFNRERRETRERVIIGESLPRPPLRDAAPYNAQRRIG